MICGAEEDGDGEVDVLVNVDGRMSRRKGAITPLVDEGIVSEKHVLMDATPFSYRKISMTLLSLVGPSSMTAPRTKGRIQGRLCIQAVSRVF